ncbi:variable surface protein, partial [Plasmodium gonderi]
MPKAEPQDFKKTDLPSFKFYKFLDKDPMNLNSSKLIYCSIFNGNFDNLNKIKELCSKYVTYLIKQKDIQKIPGYNNIDCKLLTYWLSEELLKSLKNNQRQCIIAFAEIQRMWSHATSAFLKTNPYKCKPYDPIIGYYDKWENAKKLYDYYVNFNYLHSMANTCNGNCDELCMYLDGIAKIYEIFKKFCSSKIESRCPVFNIDYEEYDPLLLISKFNCNPSTQILDIRAEEPSQVDHQEDLIFKEASSTPLSKIDSQEESELISDQTKPLSVFGNSLLALVLTSMLFGVLYKVNANYINLYKFYKLHNKSLLQNNF